MSDAHVSVAIGTTGSSRPSLVISTLVVCREGQAADAAESLPRPVSWVYIGKDLARREATARQLKGAELRPLGDLLHKTADRLRQPFLDFIADLGSVQTDQFGWWSSSCAWKDGGRSDLFLLVCYEHMVDELRRSWAGTRESLLIVVEDPWLFRQLQETLKGIIGLRLHGKVRLWPSCIKALVLGTGTRLLWSLRLIRNYVVQRWCWVGRADQETGAPTIGLYTYPQSRCLSGEDGWEDPYFGDLDRRLETAGYRVLRLTPPEVGGFERALARRATYVAPLILQVTPGRFLRALFATWYPVWPGRCEVGGLPIGRLLLREWWLDRWRSSYLLFHLFHSAMSRLLRLRRFQLLIFPYENQPWEKMLILAARTHGTPTLGYQHGGGLSRYNLASFFGAGEAQWAPLADLIVASGSYTYDLMAEGGTPRTRLIMGGNLRHQYLRARSSHVPVLPTDARTRVLVTLPIDEALGRHLLHALGRAFPDGGAGDGLEFVIKPHPMCSDIRSALTFHAGFAAGSFEAAVARARVVLYTGTGTGMEALVLGRTVLRYRSELLLNTDRAEWFGGDSVVDCGDQDLRARILSTVHRTSQEASRTTIETLLQRIFSPPDYGAWQQAVAHLCGGCV